MQNHEREELMLVIRQVVREEMQDPENPINRKLEPMYKIFSKSSGFSSVFVWLLKTLILVGGAAVVSMNFIKWLRGQ